MNIDPLAEKYYDTSSYVYTMNNPVFYVDPDGREVDVSDLVNSKNKNSTWLLINLMASLSKISGEKITISTDSNNKSILMSKGCGDKCGSNEGSSYVNHLLSSKESVKVMSTKEGTHGTPSNNVSLNAEQIYGMQKGLSDEGIDSKTVSVGLVFLHETLHTRAGSSFFDSAQDKKEKDSNNVFPDPLGNDKAKQTGPTVKRVNKFRKDMNLPIRYIYGNISGTMYFKVKGNKKEIKYTNQPVPKSK